MSVVCPFTSLKLLLLLLLLQANAGLLSIFTGSASATTGVNNV